MSGGNSIPFNNDIIKESNNSQPTSFITQDNNQEPKNANLNYEEFIDSVPQVEPENSAETEVDGEHNNMRHNKRRSKKQVEGRNYVCKLCSKSYLSYPALYTHYKQKHNTNNSLGRGRGRPKKDSNNPEDEKNKYNPTNHTYFAMEGKTGKTDPKNEINDCIDIAFNELYNPEKKFLIEQRNIKFYSNVDDHPFLSKFKNDIHDMNQFLNGEHEIADLVFIEYLNKMSAFCNPHYYVKLLKFVTLFREHVNLVNRYRVGELNREYTECNDSEDVPDSREKT